MLKRHFLLVILFLIIVVLYALPQLSHLKQSSSQKLTSQKDDALIESDMLSKIHVCFEKTAGKTSCYKEAADDILKHTSLQKALSFLEKNQIKPEIFQSCHEMAHFLGRTQYSQIKDVGKALSDCLPICFSGCYHGVLEQYLIDKNLSFDNQYDSRLAKEVPGLCGKREGYEQRELYNQCLHGLGHALMFLTDNELPKSLKLCDELKSAADNLNKMSDGEWCYSGAFMENSTSSTNKDHPSKYLSRVDPMYPCNILDEKYLDMCYALQSFYFADFVNYDWRKTFQLCQKVPYLYQATCFRSIGQNLVGFTQDLNLIKTNCGLTQEVETEKYCIQGVILALNSKYGGDYSRMVQFCSIIDTKYKKSCYTQLGLSVRDWLKSDHDLAKVCTSITEEEYRSDCIKS